MNLPRKTCAISFVILSGFSNSCSNVMIKNAEWCGDAGSLGALCFHTLSDDEREMTKEQWDAERFGMICTKSENFAEWKTAILKLCRKNPICTYEMTREVRAFSMKVARVAKRSRR